jgi:hypothetical protein
MLTVFIRSSTETLLSTHRVLSPQFFPRPPQITEQERIQHGALKSREHRRINNLKILHFDWTDNELVQITKSFADSFISALNLRGTVSEEQILNALQQAHIASDGYYNVTHA